MEGENVRHDLLLGQGPSLCLEHAPIGGMLVVTDSGPPSHFAAIKDERHAGARNPTIAVPTLLPHNPSDPI